MHDQANKCTTTKIFHVQLKDRSTQTTFISKKKEKIKKKENAKPIVYIRS